MCMVKKIISTVLISSFLLSGCQNTPDTVKEKSQNYITSEKVQRGDTKYVSVEHILDDQEKILKKKYQNLKLLDTIRIEQPEHVSVLSLGASGDFSSRERMQEMAFQFFGNHKWDDKIKNYTDLKWASGVDLPVYGFNADKEAEGIDVTSGHMDNYGFYSLTRVGQPLYVNKLSHIYHADWGKSLGTCKLNGKKISVDKAVDFVNDWCNTKWVNIEKLYEYRVKTVYRCRYQKKDYLFFEVCRYYKGVPFDDISFFIQNSNSNYEDFKLDITMQKEGELSAIRNNELEYDIKREANSDNKLISLEDAVKIAEETMTGSRKYEIADIDIKYVLKWQGKNPAEESVYAPGTPYEARPTWAFIIDAPEYQKDSEWAREFINVDMITGEVLYCHNYDEEDG